VISHLLDRTSTSAPFLEFGNVIAIAFAAKLVSFSKFSTDCLVLPPGPGAPGAAGPSAGTSGPGVVTHGLTGATVVLKGLVGACVDGDCVVPHGLIGACVESHGLCSSYKLCFMEEVRSTLFISTAIESPVFDAGRFIIQRMPSTTSKSAVNGSARREGCWVKL